MDAEKEKRYGYRQSIKSGNLVSAKSVHYLLDLLDEKDHQIKVLKAQNEIANNECKDLKEDLKNLKLSVEKQVREALWGQT